VQHYIILLCYITLYNTLYNTLYDTNKLYNTFHDKFFGGCDIFPLKIKSTEKNAQLQTSAIRLLKDI